MTNTQLIIACMAVTVIVSFLAGVDQGLKDKQERMRMYNYCQSDEHSETLCKEMRIAGK